MYKKKEVVCMETQFNMEIVSTILFMLFIRVNTFQTSRQTTSIVKAVADWYGINCIVLFRSKGTDMTETEGIFRIFKLSMHAMDMMEVKDLKEENIIYRYNSDRCSKMLYVADERRNNSKSKLEQLSHSTDLSGPIWLLFLPSSTSPSEYFKNTKIPFNTDFLTAQMQEETYTLKQVYRVTENHALRIIPFGYWSEGTDLVLDQYYPHSQRDDLEGKVFRVSAIENWPLTLISDTHLGGFFGKVWTELEERLNFSTVYIKPKDSGIGVWNGKEWNGLMGMIVRGEIDAVVSEVTVTTERLDVVDFLIPLYITRYQIFFKPPGLLIQWDLIFRPFEKEVWIALALWSGLTTLLLMACHKIALLYGVEDSLYKTEYQYFFVVVSAFCQQGLSYENQLSRWSDNTPLHADRPRTLPKDPLSNSVLPKSVGCRLIVITTYLFSSVIVIIYSCTLTSMIATQKPIRPFDSLESFLEDGTYTLEQIPGSDSYNYFSNSTDHVLQEIYRTLFSKVPDEELPKSHKSAMKRVCESQKIAHFGEFGVAAVSANQISQNEGCPIIVLQHSLKLLHLTMALTKDSPYRDALNYQLSKMLNTGIISRFRNVNFPLWGKFNTVPVSPAPAEQLVQVNFLFLGAVIVSVCAFVMEFAKSKSADT